MKRRLYMLFSLVSLFFVSVTFAKAPADLSTYNVNDVMNQLFEYHIDQKEINPILLQRSLKIYVEHFDPAHAYFLTQEINPYIHPNSRFLVRMLEEYVQGQFTAYFALNQQIRMSIYRAREWRKEWLRDPVNLVLEAQNLKKEDVELKRSFAYHEVDLQSRHKKFFVQLVALQLDHLLQELPPGKEGKVVALCEKQIRLVENRYLGVGEQGEVLSSAQQEHLIVLRILKSLAKSLDAHTAYYSPEEALAMRVQLEKGMCGIGVVLSEGIDGVQVAEIIKGGPADLGGVLQQGDTIIEIDGESVKEYSFTHVLDILRGEEGSKTVLGIIRFSANNPGGQPKFIRVKLVRSKITLNDKRVDYTAEPFGDGVIGKITLHSFYEGANGISSEKDIRHAIQQLSKEGPLYGVVLDLRDNTGGFLSQAVRVSGLFISSGVVVISKYSDGSIKYYRAVDGATFYDGPLVVMISKGSASATEIVAQTLQDYGVAVVVGDETSYGKGTIQHQTVTNDRTDSFFKVTIGRYYTVSGKSTQIGGVKADIVVPTSLKYEKIGEAYLEYPLPPDSMKAAFEDPLTDLDPHARKWFKKYYLPIVQKPFSFWKDRLALLQENSYRRMRGDHNYQAFLEVINPAGKVELIEKNYGLNDLQMTESVRICQDMVLLLQKANH